MTSRRTFIKSTLITGTGLSLGIKPIFASRPQFTSHRPAPNKRKFSSPLVDKTIEETKKLIKDPEVSWMFENCFPNTLDTTIDYEIIDGKPDTFVITGDIDAMWLRDSTAQVWPYMPLINDDPKLKKLVQGLVNRQTKCVLLDPYANAFYKDLTRVSEWVNDRPQLKAGVHERKWEIDSLCYTIRLANEYYQITKDTSLFDADWDKAMRLIVKTFKTEQRKDGTSPYYFIRPNSSSNMIDAPSFSGKGRPVNPVGLICSMFRPSDDATLFPFLIPSNLFAVQSLRQLAFIYKNELNDKAFAAECSALADEVEKAVKEYAIFEHPKYGQVYAYEIDGFGARVYMDDANVPSLISLGYIGYHNLNDELYRNTRRLVLSTDNPYYLVGKAAEGQSSPHTGKENIWPMGIILRGLTSTDKSEIKTCISMLKATHAGTGFMHESFHKDDPANFSRKWFAWANTLFGEFILKTAHENPDLLKSTIF